MDVNPVVLSSPIGLARHYAASVFSKSQFALLEPILTDFQSGRVQSAFRRLESTSPEFEGFQDFSSFRQFSALLRKIPWEKTDVDREKAAIASFFSTESRCKRSNKRLEYYSRNWGRLPRHLQIIMTRAKRYVAHVMGEYNLSKQRAIYRLSRPGGGVAIGVWNKHRTEPTFKYVASDLTTTLDAFSEVSGLVMSTPGHWQNHMTGTYDNFQLRFPLVAGARLSFVPKDGRTLRSIAIEPNLNMMMQLGVHEFLADRLRVRAQTDISDQTLNQQLSLLASKSSCISNTFATIDLSSASDSISRALVKELVPSSWYSILDALRSKTFSLKGKVISTEKFSTMGNGFTFALETLIFKALAESVRSYVDCGGLTSCYGDDIIIPSECAPLLMEVFRHCGLVINNDKSFVHGPFRESCGTDWYEGRLTTPLYIREERVDRRSVHRLINSWGSRPGRSAVLPFLLKQLKKSGKLLYGLENEDESSCIFTTFAYAKGAGYLKYNPHLQTHTFLGISEKSIKDKYAPSEWRYLKALITGGPGDLNLRGHTKVWLRRLTPGRKAGVWYDVMS